MPLPHLLDQLAAIVGQTNLIVDALDASAYTTGARGEKGVAAFVAKPATTVQASRIVQLCVSQNVPFVVQGANTGLVAGSVPDETSGQGVINLDRLNKSIDVDVANRSVLVGAGVRLSALNEALSEHGYQFPIDLGSDPSVGGMISTNTGGSRFIRYGDVRDHVLGLEVVLLDQSGTVLNLLGRLRKNNIGLETAQLFIGTSGRYGIVTKAVLDVARLPAEVAAAIVIPRDQAGIIDLLLSVEAHFGNELTTFEGMSRNAMACALQSFPNLRNPFAPLDIPPYALLIELARVAQIPGDISLEEKFRDYLMALLEQDQPPLSNAFFGPPEAMWSLRHSLTEGLRTFGRVIAVDLAFARQDAAAFREDVGAWAVEKYPQLMLCDFGHIGDGGIHFNFVEPATAATPLSEAQIAEFRLLIVEHAVTRYGGSFSAEHGIGRSNIGFYKQFVDPTCQDIANGIESMIRRLT